MPARHRLDGDFPLLCRVFRDAEQAGKRDGTMLNRAREGVTARHQEAYEVFAVPHVVPKSGA